MDGIADILAIMSSEENHVCTTAEVETLKLCFNTMNKMKTELDDYSHIVDTMRGNIVYLFGRCEQLEKDLQDAVTTNAMILEVREAETEKGNTALQEDNSVALARQLQEEENNQIQLSAEGERLSEEVAKLLDREENPPIATRVSSRRTRAPRQQSSTSTTQEKSVSDMKPTKKLTKKRKTLPDNDGSDSVQMDVRKEGEDDVEPTDRQRSSR
jgi:type IV secretory pathway VirJ component